MPETAWEKPVAQLAHTAELVAPVTLENVLAAQSVHTALPVAILYLPAAQEVHVSPFGPVKPMLQVQAATAELEIGELEPVGHAIHVVATVAPTVVEYVPPPQSVHAALPVAVLYLPVVHVEQTFELHSQLFPIPGTGSPKT